MVVDVGVYPTEANTPKSVVIYISFLNFSISLFLLDSVFARI